MIELLNPQSPARAVRQISPPLMWQDVLRLYGVRRIPGEEDPSIRDLILQSTAERLDRYGEAWFREERESLLASAAYLASLIQGLS